MKQILKEAIKLDSQIAVKSKKLRSVLMDLVPEKRAEINLMVITAESGVAGEIAGYAGKKADIYARDRWLKILHEEWAIDNDKALSAITIWADVLGVKLPENGKKKFEDNSQNRVQKKRKTDEAFVLIRRGRFMMGSDYGHLEQPVHEVTINYDFEIAKYPVTFEEYDLFCEDTGREKLYQKPYDKGWGRGRRPVINVSWYDAKAYCKWLSEKTGETYRLPTEAEWEYVCRAGTTTKWSFGDDEKEFEKYGWYEKNSDGKTHPVGEKLPNPWGLYDMHGNVWEWCEDDWADNYKETPRDGSANHNQKEESKVLRGGSWYLYANHTRSAFRFRNDPDFRYFINGFRLLRTVE